MSSKHFLFICLCLFNARGALADDAWEKVVVYVGEHTNTAVGGDFTGDGLADVICNSANMTRLFVAPDWREIVLDDTPEYGAIHSEVIDVDDDGDLDWIGARYLPGLIFWLEQPDEPLRQRWPVRIVDAELQGVHGLLRGDIDGDGRLELIANSAQPLDPLPSSAVWYRTPGRKGPVENWQRHVFAAQDAPGLSHYFGFGDVDGDGRPDISLAAKGGDRAESTVDAWFAWWQAPADPTMPWRKHLLADHQGGATNIQPADVNGDGQVDFIAARGHARGVLWFEAPEWTIHEIHATIKEPHSLAVADFDGDGDVDCATCAFGDETCAWFENDGEGQFTTHLIDAHQAAYDIRAVDMDQDGDSDLLVAGRHSNNVVWYRNPHVK